MEDQQRWHQGGAGRSPKRRRRTEEERKGRMSRGASTGKVSGVASFLGACAHEPGAWVPLWQLLEQRNTASTEWEGCMAAG